MRHASLAPALFTALVLAACTSGASPSPTATPAPSAIDHPTGATDVVLRLEEGGGFVPMDFFATQGPLFTLYGAGTVIFRDLSGPQPDAANGIALLIRYSIARLDEAGVQSLLTFALGPGGLDRATGFYTPGNVADMPTAVFTLRAGGMQKSVSVMALGMEAPESSDVVILGQLAALGNRLRSFTASASGSTPWSPDRYRGILTPAGAGDVHPWPWPTLGPADFPLVKLPSGREWTARTMTGGEAATLATALGITGYEGGILAVQLAAPDGSRWTFALRPLLPDEAY